MINVQIKNFIISYYFIVKFCRDFLILFPVLPPSSFYAFLPPAVCICCVSLSLALSLLCTSTISPHHSSVYVCHLSLSLSCWENSLPLPLPQYVHPSCIFLCCCSAHEPFLSSSYCHSYSPSSACLPSCPLLYFLSPPSCNPYSCSSLYYSPFHLFDIQVPSVFLSAPLFSQAPLCTISLQFSLICSHKLILQEKCSCLQGCASLHCKPFSTVSNLR